MADKTSVSHKKIHPIHENSPTHNTIETVVDQILNQIGDKLPPEALSDLDVMSSIKDKLYNYININYSQLMNNYLGVVEDEMLKKVKAFIEKEGDKRFSDYTPAEITNLIEKLGDPSELSTSDIEKNLVTMYQHLHNHVQNGVKELETITKSLLLQKEDVGEFFNSENAYTILKCSFKDHPKKSKNVYQVKLSINILDNELINPIYHYQLTSEYLIREVIGNHISYLLNRDIDESKRILQGRDGMEMTEAEELFEKVNRLEEYTSDDINDENSSRYQFITKHLINLISGNESDISLSEEDSLTIQSNIQHLLESESLRDRGFYDAVNLMTAILEQYKIGYQYSENLSNSRNLIIKEYEGSREEALPDERFDLSLKYIDSNELLSMQEAYSQQMKEFHHEITQLNDVIEALYRKEKRFKSVQDFEDLYNKVKKEIIKMKRRLDPDYAEEDTLYRKLWNEISFIKRKDTPVEKENPTYLYEKEYHIKRFHHLRERVQNLFKTRRPAERIVLEKRIDFLQREFETYSSSINPFQVQPGLILDMNITSIKKQRVTLNKMTHIITDFLSGMSKELTAKSL